MTVAGQRIATEAIKLPNQWLQAVDRSGNGELPRSKLSGRDAAAEYLMMGLRVKEGVQLSHYAALAGEPINLLRARDLADLNLLQLDKDTVRTTNAGVLVLNAILRDLLAR